MKWQMGHTSFYLKEAGPSNRILLLKMEPIMLYICKNCMKLSNVCNTTQPLNVLEFLDVRQRHYNCPKCMGHKTHSREHKPHQPPF